MLHQAADILDEAFHASLPHPHAQDDNRAPEDEPDGHVDPKHDGAVHHVEDLERDEEYGEEREDGGDIGLGDEACEEWGEVGMKGAGHAESGCEEGEDGVCEGRREEARKQGRVVWQVLTSEHSEMSSRCDVACLV
jgi:hypothetical protein